jgi:hypothetical protein
VLCHIGNLSLVGGITIFFQHLPPFKKGSNDDNQPGQSHHTRARPDLSVEQELEPNNHVKDG